MSGEKPEVEKKWGWLAHIIASVIVAFFKLLESVLRAVFSLLSSLARVL